MVLLFIQKWIVKYNSYHKRKHKQSLYTVPRLNYRTLNYSIPKHQETKYSVAHLFHEILLRNNCYQLPSIGKATDYLRVFMCFSQKRRVSRDSVLVAWQLFYPKIVKRFVIDTQVSLYRNTLLSIWISWNISKIKFHISMEKKHMA